MTKLKRLGVLFVVLCLSLCLVFVVSCDNGDGNGDSNTNTNTNTSTGNGGTTYTLETLKTNLESNGYDVDSTSSDELAELNQSAKDDLGVDVVIKGAIEASNDNGGAEIYELETAAQAEALKDVLINMYPQGTVYEIKGTILILASDADALNRALTQGSGSANTNTNTNTDTDSSSPDYIDFEDVIENLESHGYDLEILDADEAQEEVDEFFSVDVTVVGAVEANAIIVYQFASPDEAVAFCTAVENSQFGAGMSMATNGSIVVCSPNESNLAHAFTKGDGTGAGNQGGNGGDVAVRSFAIVVVDAQTGKGLADAFVQYCAKDAACFQAFTDEHGMVINDQFSTDHYVAMVMVDGYEPFNGQIFFTDDKPVIVIELVPAA